jgi:iron complex transport system ATP-binding protein
MIELKQLRAGYGDRVVLRDISLRFEAGKLIVLLGPNGSGKSTLLKTIVGLNEKRGGKIFLDGVSVDTLSPRQRAKCVAYMAQKRNTPNIIARRMVLHGRFPYLSYPRRYFPEDLRIAEEALALAGAADVAETPMEELSEGQRQKVYLAMALAQDTPTILMDEPTNFLDVRHQLNLMKLACGLKDQGKCVVMVLHDIRLAMKYADEIIVLENGEVQGDGMPGQIYQSGVIDSVFGIRLSKFETTSGPEYYYE